MPTYDYICSACGHKFEKFQSMKSAPIKQCPACKKNKAVRQIGTGAGLIFKGSGFYITDYRSEAYKEKAKADSGASESKPAAEGTKTVEAKGAGDAGKKDSAVATKPAGKSDPKPATKSEPAKSSRKSD